YANFHFKQLIQLWYYVFSKLHNIDYQIICLEHLKRSVFVCCMKLKSCFLHGKLILYHSMFKGDDASLVERHVLALPAIRVFNSFDDTTFIRAHITVLQEEASTDLIELANMFRLKRAFGTNAENIVVFQITWVLSWMNLTALVCTRDW
ncbi:hypothetical protein ACJX0J_019692, partial [Zea mays]